MDPQLPTSIDTSPLGTGVVPEFLGRKPDRSGPPLGGGGVYGNYPFYITTKWQFILTLFFW